MRQITIVFLLILSGCSWCDPCQQESCVSENTDPYLDNLLEKAVKDAQVALESEQAELFRITEENIIKIKDTVYVKTITWIPKSVEKQWIVAATSKNNKLVIPDKSAVWMTVVPELRSYCEGLIFQSSDDLEMRLKQRLGLDYKIQYGYLAELLIPLSELKRPCLDPKVDQLTCLVNAEIDVNSLYSEWFFERRTQLKNSDATPFTGLGYTYDWGSLNSNVGFSEFVFIGDGKTPIVVSKLHSVSQYCIK